MIRPCIFFFLFYCGHLFAQTVERRQLIDNAAMEYLQTAGNQSALYYGNPQDGLPRATNDPYLKDAHYAKARLSYSRVIYPEVLLRWDLFRDELVIFSPDFRNIVLFPENVDHAELHGHHIFYFHRDSLPGSPSSGYYILLHSGDCKVLEKQTASLMKESNYSTAWMYVFSTNFYLYRDGVYHTIRTSRGLLNVLQPYKKELKRFISANRLQFRKNTEEFLIRTVNEYEKLSGSR